VVIRTVLALLLAVALAVPAAASVTSVYGTWSKTADGYYELLMAVPPSDGGSSSSSLPSANQGNDIYDLDHTYAYEWALTIPDVPDGYSLDWVSVLVGNLTDYRYAPGTDKLFINLLDTPKSKRSGSGSIGTATNYVNRYSDGGTTASNYFANWPGDHALLDTYVDTNGYSPNNPATWDDYELRVTDETQLGWVADGKFGWGIDPDCHFYNSGITLTAHASAPELPPALLLGAVPVAGLAMRRYRKR